MKISTGLPLFNTPVDPQGTENQSPNAIFHAGSKSLTSHVIDVSETPIVLKAYGFLSDTSTITVWTVTTEIGNVVKSSPMVLNGHSIQLSNKNNTLVIDITGKYKFVLSDGLGTTTCVYHESGLSLWAYGLAAFAEANGVLQFVDTETIHPVVVENKVQLYAKISNIGDNLINARGSPSIPDDPNPSGVIGATDEYGPEGIYYGPTAPIGAQYVSSSAGDNNNNGTSPSTPIKSIHHALQRLPDGTTGYIFLKAGDIFYTYLDNAFTTATINPNMNANGVVTGYPFFVGQNMIYGQLLNFGNRKIYFAVYNDPAVDAINQYMSDYNIGGYDPYVVREINRPEIWFVTFSATDNSAYMPSLISTGVAADISFKGIKLHTTALNVANPSYTWGCFPGTGSVSTEGGDLFLGSIPLLGGPNSGGSQAFSVSNCRVTSAAAPDTPAFNHSGAYLNVGTFGDYTGGPGSGAYIPPGTGGGPGLPYTRNGNDVESTLAAKSFWKGVTIYDAKARSYRRVKIDIVIGHSTDEVAWPPPGW